MKKLTAILFLMCLGMMSFAQEATTTPDQNTNNDEIRTLFGKGKKATFGWFLGPNGGYTKFSSSDVSLAGLSAGLIINHNFTIGLTAYGIANNPGLTYEKFIDGKDVRLEGGWGGLLIEYTLFPKAPVHVTFPVLIGGGQLAYHSVKEEYTQNGNEWDWNHERLDSDKFFIVEPGVKAEVNIFRFMRFGAGVSYRYTPDLELLNTSAGFINNFTVSGSLKFGKF